jgi:hypothetical protein
MSGDLGMSPAAGYRRNRLFRETAHRQRPAPVALLLTAFLAAAATATAQVPDAGDSTSGKAPGLFRLGRLYLTPHLRLGTLGVDTNVFYTATERRTDLTGSGGPGLDLVLPIRRSLVLTVGGGLDYVYFLRTESQRRLAGEGRGRVDVRGSGGSVGLEAGYRRSFSRPSFEVDRRIVQDQRHGTAEARLHVGARLELRGHAAATRIDLLAGQDFRGADLRRSLSRDSHLGRLATAYWVTRKTAFLVEGDHQADRFAFASERDADSNRLGAGFEVRSTTRLSGRAVAGARSFRMKGAGQERRMTDTLEPWAAVDIVYHFGPHTRLGIAYNRDLEFSAFTPVSGKPTISVQTYRTRMEKALGGALDLRVFGALTQLRSHGPVSLQREVGDVITAVRDDQAWEGGADLGYTFRRHVRIGIAASYTERRSTIDDFGIEGLLAGATITFIP